MITKDYSMNKVGEFYEVFNNVEIQTEFVSESRPVAVHALANLLNSGVIEQRLLQPTKGMGLL